LKNVYENEMKLEFLSKSNNESFARITIAAFVAQLDPTIEEISDIKTAVSEAVTNSIIHGYEEKEGMVKIECKLFANSIEIEILDEGKGIENVEKARQALYTSKPELERSGMGFTIMESFMDEVKIESVLGIGTKVTMKKIIKTRDIPQTMRNACNWGLSLIPYKQKELLFMYEIKKEDLLKAQNNDDKALTDIIETNSGLLWSIVKRFLGRGYDAEELYQIACVGFIKAIKRFNVDYDVKLSTYAVPYILGEIKRFIRDDRTNKSK